ncbi:MAG: 3-phosphoshikimate 1-carboxyvinyltransferase, partial [Candidatus Omnitrophica bacterium]|nr:3-phosphoshikimate 1-carboxyvinyltransferase [Candidatus Omnitrophota bacterium]
MKKKIQAGGLFLGDYAPPGDKSISHRAVMFGSLAKGKSRFENFLEADDCLRTIQAFQSMGISISLDSRSKTMEVEGKGLQGLTAPSGALDLGNSGTTMRLLLGILAGQRFQAILTGDDSLCSRPMKRVTRPLKQMGAQIKGRDDANFAPLTIHGGKLKAIDLENALASAQVKSAILFAGLYAEGKTRILERIPSRDHTERFMKAMKTSFQKVGDSLIVEKPTQELKPIEVVLPGDFSSAAFFITGAAMKEGCEVRIKGVGLNPTRTGLLQILKRMGASIEIRIQEEKLEPIGEVRVKGGKLKGTRIAPNEIPSVIDELPVLMVACALAEGESLISGASELRVKETDRIHSMSTNLNAIGGKSKELPDGCLIEGVKTFKGGKVESFGDHRTAMAMAIAALSSEGDIEIEGVECVQT